MEILFSHCVCTDDKFFSLQYADCDGDNDDKVFLSQMLLMKTIKFYFHFSDAGCVSSVEQMVGTRVSSGGGGFSNSILLSRIQSGQK